MKTTKDKDTLQRLLSVADIRIDGSEPWDLKIKDPRAVRRILRYHNLGLGESYMDDWVECERWDEFVTRIFTSPLEREIRHNWRLLGFTLQGMLLNLGSKPRAFKVGEVHYDAGNELYEKMLDKRMVYTCGYWKDADNLDDAQEAKLDLVCRKIGLKEGERVLDIGCGWGSFARFAAERYGARVVGVTVSKEQVDLGNHRCEGLPVEIRLQDYRDVNEEFDHIVSLGMFEHVTQKNYRTYFEVAHRCLKDDGLFLLHTIGSNVSHAYGFDPWIERYIFPNSTLPSSAQIARASEGLFVMEDWHNFGADYDKTLMAWHANFEKSWPEIADRYNKRFYRMWRYYLLICAGAFRARHNQLWQVVLSKNGVDGGYASVR